MYYTRPFVRFVGKLLRYLLFIDTYHCNDGLDSVRGGLFAAGLLDEAGPEVLDVEGNSLDHRFTQRGPILAKFWKKEKKRENVKSVLKQYILSLEIRNSFYLLLACSNGQC